MSFANRKFGRLTIRYAVDENDHRIYSQFPDRYYCDCSCGNELVVWRSLLVSDVQKDCGMCRATGKGQRNHLLAGHIRHFMTRDGRQKHKTSAEYNSWSQMRGRCVSKKHHAYDNYGGRGIRVCERWSFPRGKGFRNFLADMGPRPAGKTLDRIDPQGHYEPTNCRWADAMVQANNQRRFVYPNGAPPMEKVKAMEARVKEVYEWKETYDWEDFSIAVF
jgi:hypothetical protein